jgi:hypothetical protein
LLVSTLEASNTLQYWPILLKYNTLLCMVKKNPVKRNQHKDPIGE